MPYEIFDSLKTVLQRMQADLLAFGIDYPIRCNKEPI